MCVHAAGKIGMTARGLCIFFGPGPEFILQLTNMNTLAIDTSALTPVVVIQRSDKTIVKPKLIPERKAGESLAMLVDDCLKQANLKPQQIDRIGIGRGPGSFTGLRIGFSFVKGFSLRMNNIPVVTVCSYAVTAKEFLFANSFVAVIGDARAGELFVRLFGVGYSEEVILCSIDQFKEQLEKNMAAGRDVMVVARDAIAEVSVREGRAFPESLCELVRVALESKTQGLEPNYVKQANAKTIKEREEIHRLTL